MKPSHLLFAAIIILSLSGCNRIMFRLAGFTKPQLQNETSIKTFASGIGLDTSDIYTVNFPDYLSVFSRRGIPDGLVFTKSGDCIEYKQSDTSCNAGLFPFITNLSINGKYKVSDTISYSSELAKLRTLKGYPVHGFDPATYDYLFFIYWTCFEGKLNKDHVKEWQDLASANPNATIKTILVNLDVQESWANPRRDEILKAMQKAVR